MGRRCWVRVYRDRVGLRLLIAVGKYKLAMELLYPFPHDKSKPTPPKDCLEVVARGFAVYGSKHACIDENG